MGSNPIPPIMASKQVIDRAKKLVREGRILEVQPPTRIFRCESDSGEKYVIIIGFTEGNPTSTRCNCEAGKADKECAHAIAALTLVRGAVSSVG